MGASDRVLTSEQVTARRDAASVGMLGGSGNAGGRSAADVNVIELCDSHEALRRQLIEAERERDANAKAANFAEDTADRNAALCEAAQARADALQNRVKQLEDFIDGHGLAAPGEERQV